MLLNEERSAALSGSWKQLKHPRPIVILSGGWLCLLDEIIAQALFVVLWWYGDENCCSGWFNNGGDYRNSFECNESDGNWAAWCFGIFFVSVHIFYVLFFRFGDYCKEPSVSVVEWGEGRPFGAFFR